MLKYLYSLWYLPKNTYIWNNLRTLGVKFSVLKFYHILWFSEQKISSRSISHFF